MQNKVTIEGRLLHPIELRFTENKKKFIQFPIETTRAFTTSTGEEKEKKSTIYCEAWDSVAERVAGKCGNAKEVTIKGYLEEQQWEYERKLVVIVDTCRELI